MPLKDLRALGERLKEECKLLALIDVKLPSDFKENYARYIDRNHPNGYASIKFGEYSAEIITTTKKRVLLPNSWFFTAASLSEYISEILEYRTLILAALNGMDTKAIAEESRSGNFPNEIGEKIQQACASEEDAELVVKFLTDYSWWGGGKTIDRGDFYVSPVMKLGGLLAETQSAIAEIAMHFSQNNLLKDALENLIKESVSDLTSAEPLSQQVVIDYAVGLEKTPLCVKPSLPTDQLSALLSKNFLILTGLSGSGKTQLAQAFSKWVTAKQVLSNPFVMGVDVEAAQSTYAVLEADRLGIKVSQSGGSSNTFLPYDLIEEWGRVIVENGFSKKTPSTEIKEKVVAAGSQYSGTLSSFNAPLKALAFYLLENSGGEEADRQYELVAVGADWTSNENLLGYPNALHREKGQEQYCKPDNGALDLILRARANSDLPHFLILDEMNLSHVERYFADFLSAMESGEAISLHDDTDADWGGVPAKLTIPKNLFVIGTVNVDETTYMFSPKVLDRANVIEFRVSDEEMKKFLKNPVKPDLDSIAGQGAQYAKAFVSAAKQRDVPLDDEVRKAVSSVLMEFFPALKEAGAEFGYRTAHEICRFVYFHKELSSEPWKIESAMDAAIMQKLLPKLHGSKKKLGPVLETLAALCGEYPASAEKIERMRKRLGEHGFTSFAEA